MADHIEGQSRGAEGIPGEETTAAATAWQTFSLLSVAMDATGAAVAITDTHHTLRYANTAFGRIVGRSSRSLMGLPISTIFPEAVADVLCRDDDRVVRGRGRVSRDRLIPVGETVTWFTVQKDPLVVAGRCIGVVTILFDLTERLASERDAVLRTATPAAPRPAAPRPAAPRPSAPAKETTPRRDRPWPPATSKAARNDSRPDSHYALLSDNATDVISTHDAKGRCTFVSPSCRRVLGYGPESLTGQDPLALCHPDDAGRVRLAMGRLRRDAEVRGLRYRFHHARGHYIWIEVNLRALRDPVTGAVHQVVAVTRDVGEQVREADALRRSRQLYKGLFDGSSAPMLLVDPDQGRILQANAAASQFYGHSIGKLRRMTAHDLNTLPVAAAREARWKAVTRSQTVFEMRHRLASGAERDVHVNATPLVLEGRTVLFVIVHDITERKAAEADLQRSHANLDAFFSLSRDFLTVLDRGGHVLEANPSVVRRLGWPREALIGRPVTVLHPAEHRCQVERAVRQALKGSADPLTAPLRTRVGAIIPAETRLVRGTWNGRTALFCASRDLSDLALSEEKFEKAFMNNATLMAITDPDTGRFIDINTSFLRVLGQDGAHVLGKTLVDFGIVPDEPTRCSMYRELQRPDRLDPQEVRFVAASGAPFIGEISAQRIASGPQDYLLVMITDITSQRTLMDELEHQATHDMLTGAFNRVVTDRILDHETRRAERVGTPVSLVIADIDLFKAINDHFGHPVGDAVLKEVVRRLSERIRETDLLARWGGEEFLVILPGTEQTGAHQLAETLRAAVAEAPIAPVGTVTISAGVATFRPGEAVQQWIARADEALYDAKENGRNRVAIADVSGTGDARGPLDWKSAPMVMLPPPPVPPAHHRRSAHDGGP